MYGRPGTNQERTFIAVKPDGVQRGLIGDIIARFEKRGYKLVGLKMVWPTLHMAEEHYADLRKKPFYPGLTKFFSSGPIVCMCWEGKDAIKQGRQMLGEVCKIGVVEFYEYAIFRWMGRILTQSVTRPLLFDYCKVFCFHGSRI